MPNPLFPTPDKPILDLTSLVVHPLREEIWLALMVFISIFLILWLISKLFHLKKQDYKTAILIAIIVAATSFIIRSISLLFSLSDVQKPPINRVAMIVEVFLLLILIKKAYNLKWLKTIGIWILTYFGKLMIMSIMTLIVLFFFTTIPQDISSKGLKDSINISNFEIIKINDHTFNTKADIKFLTRTENFTITDLKCMMLKASLFPDGLEDHTTEYKFESFKYQSDLKAKGSAYFECGSACINNKALMNTASTKGTKIIFIESGEEVTVNFDFIITGSDSRTIKCTPIFNSQNPEFTTPWYEKLFEIDYVGFR